jgi:hypothetical protein
MTDAEFITAFEKATLPRPFWTHEAHIRMAYLYLRGLPDANLVLPMVRERIRFYNEAHGNKTGYHETITVAFLTLVAQRLRSGEGTHSWEEFRTAHNDLIGGGMAILRHYYTEEILFSPEARVYFIAPNRIPLP